MSPTAPKTPARQFSVAAIGRIVILGISLISTFIIGCLGAPPSKTPFGPVVGPEGPFRQVANDFLIALKEGRHDAAYELTSTAFQQRLTLDGFRDLQAKHPFPGYPGFEGTANREDAGRGVHVYTFDGEGPGGRLKFSFEVGKEREMYSVTALTIE